MAQVIASGNKAFPEPMLIQAYVQSKPALKQYNLREITNLESKLAQKFV